MPLKRFGQLLPVISIHSPGQSRPVKFIARQRLGLFIVNALQQIFQTTQEEISLSQLLSIVLRQQMQCGNRA